MLQVQKNSLIYLERRGDHETKLWKALNARLGPGQVGWGEIVTLRDSQGVFWVEIAMFWLGCGRHGERRGC